MMKALGVALLFLTATAPAMAGQTGGSTSAAPRTFAPMPVSRTFGPPQRSFDPVRVAAPVRQTSPEKVTPPTLPVRRYYPVQFQTYEERYDYRPHCAAIPPPTQFITYGCALYPFALGIDPEDS